VFLNEQYWQPVSGKLAKREEQVRETVDKIKSYRLVSDLKYRIPLFSEMTDPEQKATVLQKFTKANLKLAKSLDGS
jgi:hypothetical protein